MYFSACDIMQMFSEFARRLKSFGFVSGRNCRPTTQVQFPDKYSKNRAHMHKIQYCKLETYTDSPKATGGVQGPEGIAMSYVFLVAGI